MNSLCLFFLTTLFLITSIHGTTEPNDQKKKELLQKNELLSPIISAVNFDGRPTNFKSKENDLPPEAQEKASMVQELQNKMQKLIHTVKSNVRKEIAVPDTSDDSATPDSSGLLQKGKARLQQFAEKGESAKKKITNMISDLKNINGADAKKKITDMMSDIKNTKDSKIEEIKDTMKELLNNIKNKFGKGEINTEQPFNDMLTEAFEKMAKQRKITTKIICVLILICVGIIVCVAVYKICHRKPEKDKVSKMEQGNS